MRTSLVAETLLLLIGVALAGPVGAGGVGSPPPTHSLPAADIRELVAPVAMVLSSERGDSVLIATDTLETLVQRGERFIHGPTSANRFELATGETLEIIDSTPGGSYRLADGNVLELASGTAYPRIIQFVRKRTRSVTVRLRSKDLIGALLLSASETVPDAEVAARRFMALLRRGPRYDGFMSDGLPRAFEYPAAWYDFGRVEFDAARTEPLRVVWIAYGSGGRVKAAGEPMTTMSPKGANDWVPIDPRPERKYPLATEMSEHDLIGTTRIVGEVILDPVTGRVVQVER